MKITKCCVAVLMVLCLLSISIVIPTQETRASEEWWGGTLEDVTIYDLGHAYQDLFIDTPSDAIIVNTEVNLLVQHTFPGDLEIRLYNPARTTSTLLWDNLGGTDDGGYDDDTEQDEDIWLNYRDYSAFNGEDPRGWWLLDVEDQMTGDTGYIDHLYMRITYELPPTVSTDPATNVTDTSATFNGYLDDLGTSDSVTVYFDWGETTSYGHSVLVQSMTAPGSYDYTMPGLTPGQQYHFRARAVGEGTGTGGDETFTTDAYEPTVRTDPATNVTDTQATLNGYLSDLGSASTVTLWFDWGETASYGHSVLVQSMTAPGPYEYTQPGLAPGQQYHFRARAVGEGTGTGGDETFTTGAYEPAVRTDPATNVTDTSATFNGYLSDLGSADTVTMYFDWGETASYGHSVLVQSMTAPGPYEYTMPGLTPGQQYHFRARAVGDGMGTGGDETFTTLAPGTVYVIITTSAIQNTSLVLPSFISSKENRGFTVQVVTEGTWGGGTGDAAAENLRSWLQSNYESMGIEYVLLIGNPHPDSGDVPMKNAYPMGLDDPDHLEHPTDFYYAELTDEWDNDGDGLYGEYNDDFNKNPPCEAEVAVGRIPYYGDTEDLDHILAKTISYENALEANSAWRENVLLPMDSTDETVPNYLAGEAIKDQVLVPAGWDFHRVYDDDYGLVPAPQTTPCTIDNVTSAWNSEDFGGVFWWTHGSTGLAVDVMDISHAATLDDTHPAMAFQGSCHNGAPKSPANLGYSLLKNGCVSTVAASEASRNLRTQTYPGNMSPGGMAYEYAMRIISEQMAAGDALNDLRYDCGADHDIRGEWTNYVVHNLYGCPAVGLYSFGDGGYDQTTVATTGSSNVGYATATLEGYVDLGSATEARVYFEWGETDSYGNLVSVGNMDSSGPISVDVTGLTHNQEYHFRATAAGAGMGYGADRSFVTLLDADAPYTSGHEPTPGAVNVPVGTNIVIHVLDDETGVNPFSFTMTVNGEPALPITIDGESLADVTFTYDPPSDFEYGQLVTVTVGCVDLAGNPLPTDPYSFRTEYEVDTTPPYTSGHNPAPGATNVPVGTNVVVHVQDTQSGVNQSTIVMTVEGTTITPSVSGTPPDYTLTYTPSSPFTYGQVVDVTVDASDLAGNTMPTDSYSFTIESGGSQPSDVWVDEDFNSSTPGWGVDHFDSIQDGIDAVASPGTVNVAAGTYNEDIIMKDAVEILGAGAHVTTIAGGESTVVVGSTGLDSSARLEGFTITNQAGARVFGMINQESSPVVANCIFSGNTVAGYVPGGGLLNVNSSPEVTNCTFEFNEGSAMCNYAYEGGTCAPTITNCTFSENTTAVPHIGGNSPGGGGMFNWALGGTCTPTVTGCTFSGNTADVAGGGMYNIAASPTVTDCTFEANTAGLYGGGMANEGSSPIVTSCGFLGNTAEYYGGGMYNCGGSHPIVSNTGFFANSSNGYGGGGMWNQDSSPYVVNCFFLANSTEGSGGGMLNVNSSPEVTNCVFTSYYEPNVANSLGGGMYNENNSSPSVVNCTFTTNSASDGGGIYNFNNSSPTVTNTIVWGNTPNGIDNHYGSSPSVTYSCIQDTSAGDGQIYPGTGNIDTDPSLVSGVYMLEAGSPCIDAGLNSALPADLADLDEDGKIAEPVPYDIDLYNRIINGTVDMGADEYSP